MGSHRPDLDLFANFRRRGARPVVLRTRPRRRWPWIVLGVLLILAASAESLMQLRVSYLFFDSLGHSVVFWTPLLAQVVLFLVGFVAGGLLLAANIPFWRRAVRNLDDRAPKIALIAGLVLAVLFGIVAGSFLAGQWQTVLLWLHGHNFGASDPYFGQDYSFFLFALPVYDDLQAVGWGVVLVSLLVTVGIAALSLSVELTPSELPLPFKVPEGRRVRDATRLAVHHAGVVLVFVFILAALGSHFGPFQLATADHSGWVGLDATQRTITRPILGFLQWLAVALAVGTAALVVLRVRGHGSELVTAAGLGALLVGWLAVAGLLQTVPAAIYQGVSVNPNAQNAQRATISDYLSTTRAAWALQSQDVESRPFGAQGQPGVPSELTVPDLAADPQTVANVRIQDTRQLPDVFNQIDRARQYQSYPTVTVDRYKDSSGKPVEVMLSPREIAEGNIPGSGFVNGSMVYTHGYGDVSVSATNVVNGGFPQVLGQVPAREGFTIPAGSPPDLNFTGTTNPDLGIYCGAGTTQPVVANTNNLEFDYLAGASEHDSHGAGVQGIRNPGSIDKLALSLTQFSGFNLLLTDALNAQSTVVLHRTITDRIQTLAPFLTVDGDPYIVNDPVTGHIVWIADAYVKSSLFPEAFKADDGTSYMRNAVKAVVDARTCQTTLYAVDSNEPLTAAYSEIFPGLLQPFDSMPAGLRAHLRYPEDLLQAQAAAYGVGHITDPDVLYQHSDQWRLADELSGTGSAQTTQTSQATYVEMTLPCPAATPKCDAQPDFVLLQTLSPASQSSGSAANNMTAWLAAQCDYTKTNHPKLIDVRLNNNSNVMGPLQFDNKINTDPTISPEISLLSRSGSQVNLGNVIILPFNNQSFLYVRPLYVQATAQGGNGYPLLRRVIVGGGQSSRVAEGDTLQQALQALLGTANPIPGLGNAPANGGSASPSPSASASASPSPGATPTPAQGLTKPEQDLLQQIAALRADAVQKQNKGDLVGFVSDQQQIGTKLDALNTLLGITATPSAAAPSAAPSASPT